MCFELYMYATERRNFEDQHDAWEARPINAETILFKVVIAVIVPTTQPESLVAQLASAFDC